MENKKALLSGKPGIGKTTLIINLWKIAQDKNPNLFISGFWTNEVKEHNHRIGFDICTTDGKKGILARKSLHFEGKYHVGEYSVDLTALEDIAIPMLESNANLILIDEIGKMELHSTKFQTVIKDLFQSEKNVIATIPVYSNLFVNNLKKIPGIHLLELTSLNFTTILNQIVELFNLK